MLHFAGVNNENTALKIDVLLDINGHDILSPRRIIKYEHLK